MYTSNNKRKRTKNKICVSSKRTYKDNSSTKKELKYIIPVTANFSLSLNRIKNSRKFFYGIIKVPTPLSNKLPAMTESGANSNISIHIRLLPLNSFSKPILLRHLFKNKTVKLLTSGDFEFEATPFASALDLVASNLRIAQDFQVIPEQSKDFLPIAKGLVYNLRRQLRKHRVKHLGLINMNTNRRTSDTNEGRAVNTIFFQLNDYNKVSRSARKKQNKIRRKNILEYEAIARAKELPKLKKRIEKRNKEKIRQIKLNERFEAAVALVYLKKLKRLEKYYPSTPEKHLDMLFTSADLPKKILQIEKEFFNSDF